MALVRILVDGYSLLHGWPELMPGEPPHSALARERLIQILTQYSDAVGTPVTVVFDGAGRRGGPGLKESTASVEVLYSRPGQTADQIIERVAHRMKPYGEVLAVTNDFAERDTVISMGGLASSCENFIQSIESALKDLKREIANYNSTEKRRYKRS
jgi:predicted RNA-binding protein with PIN domain